ncbi:MAG TPA: tetratricopeptide repeat protein, partial [Thermoanaerobaculia bacterium]|nr:tetratricopeptide repeat protein [Thermoanaerobaculia bacterium]
AGCASQSPVTLQTSPAPPDDGVEAISLLGKPLRRPALAPEVARQREAELAKARARWERNRNHPDDIIWFGRRTAYLGRYREAIDIFTDGIRHHPHDARMYRHRGHRYITIRRLDDAIRDLERAEELTRGKPDEIEPDGLPNARGVPTSSLQSNICYHLGLAWYLKGDFERALPVYQRCAALATNADRLVSNTHWLYMTLRRLGRPQEAERVLEPISSSLDVIENTAYHKLTLMYRGEIAPEELSKENPSTVEGATILYGVGNWYLYNGEPEKAERFFRQIVEGGEWAAFGYIACEAEIARSTTLRE